MGKSLVRLADRVLNYRVMPKFPMTPDGLREKADWIERRDKAFYELADAVKPRVDEIRDRMWRRYNAGGFRKTKQTP